MKTLLALTLLLAGGAGPRPAAPSPSGLAAPRAGQTFLFLAESNVAVTQAGRLLPLGSVYGQVFTFRRAEGRELVFGVEGLKAEVHTSGLPPALAPTVEDAAVVALRGQFASGQAWMYGGGVLTCRPANESFVHFQGPPSQALPVLGVWRVARSTQVELSNKNGLGPYRQVRQPLVVRLGRPAAYTFSSAGAPGSGEGLFDLQNSPACRQVTEVFADEEHLNRRLSAAPPPSGVGMGGRESSEAPVGLTKLAALWRLGAPSEPGGSIQSVLAADEWVWPGLPGRGDFVLHFREGRVERVAVPSTGP